MLEEPVKVDVDINELIRRGYNYDQVTKTIIITT